MVRIDGRERWVPTPREGGDVTGLEVYEKERQEKEKLYNSYIVVVA